MNTLRKIHTRFGLALVTALAAMAACASADAADTQVDDGSLGEATAALENQPGLRCTVSGNTSTGREWAWLVIARERHGERICSRKRTGEEAPPDFPSCYERRYELGCTIIVD